MGLGPLMATLSVTLFVLVASTCCGVAVHRRLKAGKFLPHAYVRDYVYELMGVTEEEQHFPPFKFTDKGDVALVVTDIENSTAQSDRSDQSFEELLKIHNKIIVDMMHMYGGDEVGSEGDSFIIAFAEVAHAVSFSLKVQEELLYYPWSKEILHLPSCQPQRSLNGELKLNGVRVRMGIHWASTRAVVWSAADQADVRILKGPALELTKDISDAGHGGQILLTHAAWMQLYPVLSQCKFPSVCQLGQYRRCAKDGTDELHVIYTITEWLGKGITRHFENLRRLEQVAKGSGYSIVPCPVREQDDTLTFVATRMVPAGEECLPLGLSERLFDTLAAQAQLFQGHVITVDKRRVRFLVIFAKPLDAVRFTQVSQLKLVLTKWPAEVSKTYGDYSPSETQIPLFNGPRIAMAVHTTGSFTMNNISGILPNGRENSWMSCPGISFVKDLVDVCDGGQVVLSETTWQRIQHTLPGRRKAINLGRHIVSLSHSHSMLLIELTPHMLSDRHFKPFCAIEQTGPGYYDAPSIDQPLTIVFVTVNKPKQVTAAERDYASDQSHADLFDRPETLFVYNKALDTYTDLVRQSLRVFGGYESKQLSPGRFFLAFEDFKDAILWACYLQSEMLDADWSDELLEMEECSVQYCKVTQRVLRRGLELKVGMAHGKVGFRSQTKSGQADYFGGVANLASRMLMIASPGQILVEPGDGFSQFKIRWIKSEKPSKEAVGIIFFPKVKNGVAMRELAVEIVAMGTFLAKGIEELANVYQAQVSSLAVRQMSRLDDSATEGSGHNRRRFRKCYFPGTFSLIKDAFWQLQYSLSEWTSNKNRLQMYYPSYMPSITERNGVLHHPLGSMAQHGSCSYHDDNNLTLQASEIYQPHLSMCAPSGSGLGGITPSENRV